MVVPQHAAPPRANPNVATALTWLLPGAGHLYLGQPLVALLGFSVVMGLYALGLALSDGMLFELLQPDLRSLAAGVLAPEAANIAGLVWHMKAYGFGLPYPRPFPELIHVGVWCTAISGLLNVVLMVKANVDARTPSGTDPKGTRPALLVLAGWVLPGLGHWLQGRRRRAVLVFLLITGMVVLASGLAQGANLDRERHFYYWAGQFLAGGPSFVLEWLHGHALIRGEVPYHEAGICFGALAGLLNVLALLDVQGVEADRLLGVDEAAAAPDRTAAGKSSTGKGATGGAPTILGGGGQA
ncbi:MAG: hypothetical protein RIT40_812 [Planctomycetota bacterium]|jgi:hypothetical protein